MTGAYYAWARSRGESKVRSRTKTNNCSCIRPNNIKPVDGGEFGHSPEFLKMMEFEKRPPEKHYPGGMLQPRLMKAPVCSRGRVRRVDWRDGEPCAFFIT
ncbi:MAG: hypothetical protein AMJ75_10475 [Phycisphaerae bacterium SM1_79]|nr:MAG: hypothetical protein AMJ75_10475 [Phycisphaerae bacterium SM1_79]